MKIKVQMRAKTREAELFVYGVIGGMYDDITPDAMYKELKQSGEFQSIKVRINSPGGDMYAGVAMYNLLKSQKVPVTCVVDGMAASAASLVLMAGSEREMANNSRVMIHDPWTVAMGNAADFRRVAETLEAFRDDAINTYAYGVGDKSTRKQISDWMSAETWMNGTESLARGFITRMNDNAGIPEDMREPLNTAVLNSFKNVPKDISDQHLTMEARFASMRMRALRHELRHNGGAMRKPA